MDVSDPFCTSTPWLQSARAPFLQKGFILAGRRHEQEKCTPQKWCSVVSMLLTAVIMLQCPPAASTGAPPATNPPVIVPPTLQPPATTPAPSTSTAPLSVPPTPAGRGDNLTLTQTQVGSWSHWSLIHLETILHACLVSVMPYIPPTFLVCQSPATGYHAISCNYSCPQHSIAALSVPSTTPGQGDNLTLTQAQESTDDLSDARSISPPCLEALVWLDLWHGPCCQHPSSAEQCS